MAPGTAQVSPDWWAEARRPPTRRASRGASFTRSSLISFKGGLAHPGVRWWACKDSGF